MTETLPTPAEIVAFWREAGPERWFAKDEAFDARCRERFLAAHEAAASGGLGGWEAGPQGALGLVILLDQMPRNMFRGTARAWGTDTAALAVADRAVAKGFDASLEPALRQFLYLPFMHAEDEAAQERSLRFYESLGEAHQLGFARHHHGIVARFGRFPHRNWILERSSTPEESSFLDEDAFRG